MVFQYINICQVPWEVLKTAASGLGFQHLPQDLANVNAWKTMFDPYSVNVNKFFWPADSANLNKSFFWSLNGVSKICWLPIQQEMQTWSDCSLISVRHYSEYLVKIQQ